MLVFSPLLLLQVTVQFNIWSLGSFIGLAPQSILLKSIAEGCQIIFLLNICGSNICLAYWNLAAWNLLNCTIPIPSKASTAAVLPLGNLELYNQVGGEGFLLAFCYVLACSLMEFWWPSEKGFTKAEYSLQWRWNWEAGDFHSSAPPKHIL